MFTGSTLTTSVLFSLSRNEFRKAVPKASVGFGFFVIKFSYHLQALVHFRTLVTLRRVRVRVELELRLGLVRVRIRVLVRLGLDLGLGLC